MSNLYRFASHFELGVSKIAGVSQITKIPSQGIVDRKRNNSPVQVMSVCNGLLCIPHSVELTILPLFVYRCTLKPSTSSSMVDFYIYNLGNCLASSRKAHDSIFVVMVYLRGAVVQCFLEKFRQLPSES